MPTPVGAFRLSLAEEHLDEIGSLYYQRAFLHATPEADFDDVAGCEQRLLNRADAWAMGGAQAVDLAVEFAER